jgi:hypothetical protein
MTTPPSDATDVEGLVERLEAVTEGSQQLDWDIAKAVGLAIVDRYSTEFPADDRGPWYYLDTCPEFSSSLDAALTLVPEGWGWYMIANWIGVGTGNCRQECTVTIRSPDARYEESGPNQGGTYESYLVAGRDACAIQAKTPALALCIAALRARETEE